MLVILDENDASEDTLRSMGIFALSADVPLGDNVQFPRGKLNHAQLLRRRMVVEKQGKHDPEIAWIDSTLSVLKNYTSEVTAEQVIDTRGKRLDPDRLRTEARALQRQADAIEKLRRRPSTVILPLPEGSAATVPFSAAEPCCPGLPAYPQQ